jgi:hypothetical protein
VSYNNVIQSNGSLGGGQDSWSSTSYLNGNVSLLENWSRSQLQVNYSGGGYFSTDDGIGNGWFQQLGATQTFNWKRLQLVLLDEFGYLPQSQFGFGAGTGLSTPGVGGSLGGGPTGIGAGYSPGQSIFSAVGPRYFNTAGVQTTYQLSRRSSVTMGGLYSLLRFTEPGNIESDQYVGNVGYNYQITRSNTIGLQYRFSAFHYINDPQAIGDHIIQVVFGRKITGRLALTLSGGPEITNFRVAQPPTADTQHVAGSGGASLNYLVEKGSRHGQLPSTEFTAGSGVFLGATTDQLTGSATRKVSRVWSGEIHAGYARNRSAETTQRRKQYRLRLLFWRSFGSQAAGTECDVQRELHGVCGENGTVRVYRLVQFEFHDQSDFGGSELARAAIRTALESRQAEERETETPQVYVQELLWTKGKSVQRKPGSPLSVSDEADRGSAVRVDVWHPNA